MRYSPFRHIGSVLLKRRPIQLTFFVTRMCNARCPFCFYLSDRRRGREENRPGLTLAEIKKISVSLGPLLWLAFSGGEIFLREDLPDIAAALYERNKPSIILLPTNGLLPSRIREMTEAVLKRCPKSTVVVKLSLDGPEEVHDKLRGVPGAFRKVLETRGLLSPLLARYPNFELGINSVFCRENQDRMNELIDSVRKLEGVRMHTVALIRGDAGDGRLKGIDRERYERTIERMARDLRSKAADRYRFTGAGLKAAQDVLQRRLIHDTVREKRRLIPCYAGKFTLVLTETGAVYPCEAFDRAMGNVREFGCDVKKLLESDKAIQAVRAVRQSGCHCTHECYMMMNILFNPGLYPMLIKECLRLMSAGNRCSGGESTQCEESWKARHVPLS